MERRLKEAFMFKLENAVESCESGRDTESAKQDIVRIVSDFVADKKSIGFNDKSFERLAAISLQLKMLYLNTKESWQFEISETLLCTLLSEIPRIMKQKGFKEDAQPEIVSQHEAGENELFSKETEPAAEEEIITA